MAACFFWVCHLTFSSGSAGIEPPTILQWQLKLQLQPICVTVVAGSLLGGVGVNVLFGGAGGEEAATVKTCSTVDEGAAFSTTGGSMGATCWCCKSIEACMAARAFVSFSVAA